MVSAMLRIVPQGVCKFHIEGAGLGSNILILGFWASLVTAVLLFDSIRNSRVHPAFGFGATIIVVFLYLVYFGSRTPLWQHFAANMVG